MKKFCILFSLLMSTMVFTACGAGIKYSSDSNSSGSKQTKNAELSISSSFFKKDVKTENR